MSLRGSLAGLFVITALSGGAGEPYACTAETVPAQISAQRLMVRLSTVEELATARSQLGLDGADETDLQLVTQANVCAQLRNQFKHEFKVQGAKSPFVATYYRVEDTYLVAVVDRDLLGPRPPPAQDGLVRGRGEVHLILYDLSFTHLTTFRG